MEQCLTVSQVNHFVKNLLEGSALLQKLSVSGEITDFKHQVSGHLYFSLKDKGGRLRCVMFKSAAAGLKFFPENGMDVLVKGEISVYEPTGQYQIIVRSMIPSGIGLLYQQFEAMKADLMSRGWFDEKCKKQLPKEIRCVGIVTSPSGAAIRDMISVIHRRDPNVEILLCPAQVQGAGAAETIAEGIRRLCRLKTVDVIIIGRGGGSMEDLWCFNEMPVAQAVHEADLPVISAVGHETDFTIADFVADLRAPTPSVAGELVTTDYREKQQLLMDLKADLIQKMIHIVDYELIQLDHLARQLTAYSPKQRIIQNKKELKHFKQLLCYQMTHQLKNEKMRLNTCMAVLKGSDPKNVLDKGYALVYKGDGRVLTTSRSLRTWDQLQLTFKDGSVPVCVLEK